GRIFEQSRGCIPNKRKGFAGKRVKSDVGQPVIIVVPEVHAHAGDWVAGVEQSRSRLQSDLFELAVSEIVEQEVRHLVIGNENIHEAVAIVVSDGDTHSFSDVGSDTGLLRDVLELAISFVTVKGVGEPVEELRMAVDAHLARGIAAKAIELRRPSHVFDYEQIQQPILVVVE